MGKASLNRPERLPRPLRGSWHRFRPRLNTAAIRVVEIDGEPWFVAKDVCVALGLANPSAVAQQLREGQRRTITKSILGNPSVSIPNRGLICFSEAGLYRALFLSRKREAQAFQDWVTEVVLPSIRKDGGYIAGEEKFAAGELSEDELVMRALVFFPSRPRTRK